MNYSLNLLPTKAECDKAIESANNEKLKFENEKTNIEYDLNLMEDSSSETETEITASTEELNSLNVLIPKLPESKAKREKVKRKDQLIYRLNILNERKEEKGYTARLLKELDLNQCEGQIQTIDDFITQVQAHKATLTI